MLREGNRSLSPFDFTRPLLETNSSARRVSIFSWFRRSASRPLDRFLSSSRTLSVGNTWKNALSQWRQHFRSDNAFSLRNLPNLSKLYFLPNADTFANICQALEGLFSAVPKPILRLNTSIDFTVLHFLRLYMALQYLRTFSPIPSQHFANIRSGKTNLGEIWASIMR